MATSTVPKNAPSLLMISSLDELVDQQDMITPFNTSANIQIGSTGITMEAYARGIYIGGTTGALIAVGYGGVLYTAFYTAGAWANAKRFT